ncbi:MAG: O-antigen ligase family protein [Planctomycetota bacterium]
MELLIFTGLGLCFLVACLAYRYLQIPSQDWMGIGCTIVVVSGSVIGRDFFAIEGPIPVTIDRILLGSMIGWWGWKLISGRQRHLPLNLLDIAVLLWISVLSISTLTHDWTTLGNMPASRLLFFNWMPVGLYFLARNVPISANTLRWLFGVMIGFGVYLAFVAIAETQGMQSLIFPRYIMTSSFREFLGRARGPFLNPVSNGLFLTVSFCCTLMLWPRTKSVKHRVAIVVLSLLFAAGAYLTLTRTVWLSLIAVCGLVIFLPSSRRQKGAMIVASTVLAIALFPVVSEKIFSFKRDKEVSAADMEISAQMRPMFAVVAWNMFQDRPWFGVGFGQYPDAKYPYLRDPKTGQPLTITRTLTQHNVFLAYLTETGLVGVMVLVGMLVVMLIVCRKVWLSNGLDLWARQAGLLGLVVLTVYLINGMFHDVSIIPQGHILLFLVLGFVNNILSRPTPFLKTLTTNGNELYEAQRGIEVEERRTRQSFAHNPIP